MAIFVIFEIVINDIINQTNFHSTKKLYQKNERKMNKLMQKLPINQLFYLAFPKPSPKSQN